MFVAGVWSLIWISRRTLSLLGRKGPAVFTALKQWTTTESLHLRIISRPVKRLLAFLIFRGQGEEVLFAFLTLLLFTAGWGFLGVLQDVLAKDPLVVADRAVYHFLQSLRTPWADNVFVAVTELGDSFVNIVLFCTVLLVLLVKRCYRAASFWALTVLGGLLAIQVLKWTIHLPRPVSIYDGASAFSFPSGHTTMSVVLYGFLAILIVRQIGAVWRWGLVSSVVFIAFIVGFSRLYLGAHWLSDVLGGYFIGTSWATIVGIVYLKKADKPVPKRLLAGAVFGVVLIVGGWHVTQQHKNDLSFYAPRHTIQTMALASWLTDGWRDLPAYQIDLAGEKEQPLTIQLAGPPAELTDFLKTKGWRQPQPLSLKSFLGMFSSSTPVEQLPVLPRLHNGRIDVVCLIQPVDETHRWVLRLWPTDVEISENGAPVFEGTIEIQNRRHLAGMILLATDSGKYGLPLTRLSELLNGRFTMKLVNRKGDEIISENEDPGADWYGRVLLIR